jgi:hypothetical protein
MNKNLEKEIVKHIFYNFGIKSNLVSIKDDNFLVKEFSLFEDSNYKNKIWGITFEVSSKCFEVFLVDVSENKLYESYLMFININELANYCLYINDDDNDCGLFVKLNNNWNRCSTYLSSTFLSGMETIKEIGFYPKCSDINDDLINNIKIMIGIIDEG